ncbi:A/G-specific adenine glycosylase [Candidatus Synchoanobacter obligatus]|uniref:Adenine DNA glycosylase n=1 Tax=Candidatus Synchoanobacter obligatus TaxID=2919597 RepID=A0ABT1L5W6_9GAMM|nr:A/G-specific adenine glycosylase [Candidatus Synchoanobacter obligatus]MCP8352580.1 A/G-specific adenine glycosylase [Candidatus Synchoanobacter obligatus]
MMNTPFATTVITWQKQHGRHSLPWQQNPTPYRVWVSEIMLQQTQVSTAIPYYNNFMDKFPTIGDLARCDTDTLMKYWQGLGYYSRARNLHKAATIIVNEQKGIFPETRAQLVELPGIGRSTAAAIMSLAYNQPDAILDGNVKRVLCRYHGITSDPKATSTMKVLWQKAEDNSPTENARAYTQGMMDLGANICTRTKPSCTYCPLHTSCYAHTHQMTNTIPAKTQRAKPKPKDLYLLLEVRDQKIRLIKRSNTGLWAQLYSPALFESFTELNPDNKVLHPLPRYKHKLTHLTLTIYPFIDLNPSNHEDQWQLLSDITLGLPTGIKPALELLNAYIQVATLPQESL